MARDHRENICQVARVNKASRFAHLDRLRQLIVEVGVRPRDSPPGVDVQFVRHLLKAIFFYAMALAILLICSLPLSSTSITCFRTES
jgi:hypothetical protein